jgi:hypothetical protein
MLRPPAPARAPLADYRRRPARRAPDARNHTRPGRAPRTATPRRRGARAAEAARGAGAAAEGRGLLVQGDLRDHELDLDEGQSLRDRGPPGAPSEGGRDRNGRRVRAPRAGARHGRQPYDRHGRGSWIASPPARLFAVPHSAQVTARRQATVAEPAPPESRARDNVSREPIWRWSGAHSGWCWQE